VRRVLAAAAEAKKKNLKVGVGSNVIIKPPTSRSRQTDTGRAIGEINSCAPIWDGGSRDGVERLSGEKEMHYQIRNWYTSPGFQRSHC